jgi:hypothetical protein
MSEYEPVSEMKTSGPLIVDHVEEGGAVLAAEVLRVTAGVVAAHRDHEPGAVHRRDQATARDLGDRQPGLTVDEVGVGGGVVLGPEVVLEHVADPGLGHRGRCRGRSPGPTRR